MRSPKKTALRHRSVTVSLFQSHVFKHEFFLFPLNIQPTKIKLILFSVRGAVEPYFLINDY